MHSGTEEYSNASTNTAAPNKLLHTKEKTHSSTKAAKSQKTPAQSNTAAEESTLTPEVVEKLNSVVQAQKKLNISKAFLDAVTEKDNYHRAYCAELETKCKDAQMSIRDLKKTLEDITAEFRAKQEEDAAQVNKLEGTVKSLEENLEYLSRRCKRYKRDKIAYAKEAKAAAAAAYTMQKTISIAEGTMLNQKRTIVDLRMKLSDYSDFTELG